MLSALVLTGLLQMAPGLASPSELSLGSVLASDELRPMPARLNSTGGGNTDTGNTDTGNHARLPLVPLDLRNPFVADREPRPAPNDGVELRPFPARELGEAIAMPLRLHVPELRDPFDSPRVKRSPQPRKSLPQIQELRNPFNR